MSIRIEVGPRSEIRSGSSALTTRLYGRFRDLEDLRRLPIPRTEGGRVVRLQEIAEVRRDLEKETSRAFFSWRGEDTAARSRCRSR